MNTGQTLAINSTFAGTTLEISGTATTGNAIAINNANQTLEINTAGDLTINASENISNGAISMVSGSKLTFAGTSTVAASTTLSGTGTIIAGAGTLDLQGAMSSTLALQIAAGSTLQLDANATTISNGVTFNSAASGTLDLTNPTAFSGTITGLNVGSSKSTATNQIDFGDLNIVSASLSGSTLTAVDGSGNSYSLTLASAPAAGTVVDLKGDGSGGTDAFLSSATTTDTFTIPSGGGNSAEVNSSSDSSHWSSMPGTNPSAGTSLTFKNTDGVNDQIYMSPVLRQATGTGSSIWTIDDVGSAFDDFAERWSTKARSSSTPPTILRPVDGKHQLDRDRCCRTAAPSISRMTAQSTSSGTDGG